MNLAQLRGILRHVMGFIGAFGLSIGAGAGSDWDAIAGGALALAAVIWSWADKRR